MISTNSASTRKQLTIETSGQVSQAAAQWSFGMAVISIFLIFILHFLKPELEPSWHMVSEYAIGNYGWVMRLAFFCWAISCLGLYAALRSQVITRSGRIGLVLLLIVGLSLVMAGMFVMDSPNAGKEELTTHGNLHALAGMIGIPGQAIAALLISLSLARNPAWASANRAILFSAILTLVSLIIMFGSVFYFLGETQGKFGPDTLIGWPNRLLVIAYCGWLMTVAWYAMRLNNRQVVI